MKNLFCLLILIPFVSFAKFRSGVITFNDNTTRNGFIEIPDDSENNKIKFRQEEKGKTEKFPIELVKSFVVYNENGQQTKFVITHLAYFNGFKSDNSFKIHKKWACVKVIKEGKINLYSAWFMTTGPGGGAVGGASLNGSFTSSGDLYLNKEGQDYALEFYEADASGFSITVNSWKYFMTIVEKHFGKECPDLIKLIDKDDFKKNGYDRIVDLYEQNCGKK